MPLKSIAQSSFRRVGLDLRRAQPNLVDFLASRQVTTLFDIGANKGQFGRYLRNGGYRGRIVSFEPTADAFAALRTEAEADPAWIAMNCGLGRETGAETINVSACSKLSSIKSQRPSAEVFDPQAAVVKTEQITLSTLDEQIERYAGENCFAKIDTQGFEREVLAGAGFSLSILQGVQIEAAAVQFYENAWSMSEMLDFMASKDFVVSQIQPAIFHGRDWPSAVNFDVVFRRRSGQID